MATGNCDLCGHWDSALIEGVCSECQGRYNCKRQKWIVYAPDGARFETKSWADARLWISDKVREGAEQ